MVRDYFILIILFLMLNGCCDNKSTEPNNQNLPVVVTASVSDIGQTSVICGGNITSDGGLSVTNRGVCWSIGPTPTIDSNITSNGAGAGAYTSDVDGLVSGASYYVRAYATNSAGTGYGNAIWFTTIGITDTVADVDGNVYFGVTIGNQVWMAENLQVTHYRNGDPISRVTDGTAWGSLSEGAYCEYNNDVSNIEAYGRLYNWYAVDDDRVIAPEGWHIPSDSEWQTLIDFLGGPEVAGGKLKEIGTSHWASPNLGATDASALSMTPAGYRNVAGNYLNRSRLAYFWSSTESNYTYAWGHALENDKIDISRTSYPVNDAFSVRCIKY